MQYAKSFIQYTTELAATRYDPLTVVDERKTIIAYKNGSKEAFDKIVSSNLRFVLFSLKYYNIPRNIDIMDLVQEGNLGLMEGVCRYDPKRYKCRVFTYCFWWIRFFIGMALKENSQIDKIFTQYPSGEEIKYDVLSPYILGEREDLYHEEVAKDMLAYVSKLIKDKTQRRIVILFFGLEPPYIPKTLDDIGDIFHFSYERIRQLKKEAIDKLIVEKEKFRETL
jgi:RNA polymerase sigma factor (sigma-70 family)